MIGSKIPPLDVTDAQAKRLVRGSPLRGLTPGPGMSSTNWQELAALATQLPDITWLGTVVHTFDCGHDCYDAEMPVIDGHLCYNFPAIHSGPPRYPRDGRKVPTDHEIHYHRCRFAEKVLKYGGIDFVLRLFSLYEATDVQGRGGVLQIFAEVKSPQALLHYLPKIRYFLEHRHFNEFLIPRLKKDDEGFGSSEFEVPEWAKKLGFFCDRKRQKRPPLTAQRISNALLLMVVTQGHSTAAEVRAEAIRQCREQLRAQLTKDDAFLCKDIVTSLDAWSEISRAGRSSFACFKACMTSDAPQSTRDAQGGAREARMLIEAATSGGVCVSEARAVAEMFLAKRQFDEVGMKVVCGEYGLTETATELLSMADEESKQQARTLQALGVVLDGNVAKVLDGAGAGTQKLK